MADRELGFSLADNFGDAEPEDAWHPDDDLVTLLDNLARRLFALGITRALDYADDDAAGLAALVRRWEALNVLADHARRTLEPAPATAERLGNLTDDLEHVRRRLEALAAEAPDG